MTKIDRMSRAETDVYIYLAAEERSSELGDQAWGMMTFRVHHRPTLGAFFLIADWQLRGNPTRTA